MHQKKKMFFFFVQKRCKVSLEKGEKQTEMKTFIKMLGFIFKSLFGFLRTGLNCNNHILAKILTFI